MFLLFSRENGTTMFPPVLAGERYDHGLQRGGGAPGREPAVRRVRHPRAVRDGAGDHEGERAPHPGEDHRRGRERADDGRRRPRADSARPARHTRPVPERRRRDGVVLRVAKEPQPRQLRPADVQVRARLQLPSAR